ncbi:MAG: hypothetical protein OEZ38_10165, partial [Gammaproteobacteria bacterium]|nr:hypothetical protein [Gammaproteobacteria bacterium]
STSHDLIMRAEEEVLDWKVMQRILNDFEDALKACDQKRIRELLLEAVKGYKPQCGIEDMLFKRQSAYDVKIIDINSKKFI